MVGKVIPLMLVGYELINPLSPDMKMHILLTVLRTFLMEL